MKKLLLFTLFALVACLLCSMSATAAEAYACYTSSSKTLTFYYDSQRSSRSGTTYNLNTGSNYPGWFSDGTNSSVTKVVFDSSFAEARPTTTVNWFVGMTHLTTVTGMRQYLNTSSVTDMRWMFSNCRGLTSLDVSGFNTARVRDMRYMFEGCSGLTSLDVSGLNTAQVTSMTSMFYNCRGLSILDLGSFNTANVTNMAYMFEGCSGLMTIYAGSGWTTDAVTYSNGMFNNCTSLVGGQGTTYDASHTNATYARIDGGPNNPGYFTEWKEAYACYTSPNHTLTFYCDNYRSSRLGTTYDLNKGIDRPSWYEHCYDVTKVVFDPSFDYAHPLSSCCWFMSMRNLQSIEGISHLNTSLITDMSGMFEDCTSLRNLDLRGFNTSNVMNMMLMFEECTSLTSLDLSAFNTANVTNMQGMLANCSNLRTIYAGSGWSTASVTVTYSDGMFMNCTSLVGGKGTTYSSSHVDKAYAHIDGGTSNPGYFSEKPVEAYACYTPSNTTLTFYCDNQRSSRSGTTYDLNEGSNEPGWLSDGTHEYLTKVVFHSSFAAVRPTTTYAWFDQMYYLETIEGINYLNTSSVTNMALMFFRCESLKSLDLSHFNTSKVTNMDGMFMLCNDLTSLDLSNFNTANVTTMVFMFSGCYGLTSLDVSNFNTSNVTDMESMFDGCSGLTRLDVNSFNTANVTNMSNMFTGCSGLTSLDLSNFNTANVTNMMYMFCACSGLTSLDLNSFNTSNVTNMSNMFTGCSGLTSLDLKGFNTANVEYMEGMFYRCPNLTTIYAGSEWTTNAVTSSDYMFEVCTKLVGGMGTTYNSSHVDATYAHIDGGPSNPGYFTEGGAHGDVNGDSAVNITDVTALIDLLLSGAVPPVAADCNRDGNVNITDVTALIDYLLSDSW